MTESEKGDALLRMMDMHFAKFRQSRDLQTKVNLAIWTALVVAGGFLITQGVRLDNWVSWHIFPFVSILVVYGHYRFWMLPIQRSIDRDSAFINACRKEVQSLVGISIDYPPLPQPWMMNFTIGFSGIILAVTAIILAK